MSSRENSFPMVSLEAMINSVPLVCFKDSGGTEELMDLSYRFVVPDTDNEKMAQKVHDFFSQPKLKSKLLIKALKRSDKFISNKSFDALTQVFKKYL